MGYIIEPQGVDFLVEGDMTAKHTAEINRYIRNYKTKKAKPPIKAKPKPKALGTKRIIKDMKN